MQKGTDQPRCLGILCLGPGKLNRHSCCKMIWMAKIVLNLAALSFDAQ